MDAPPSLDPLRQRQAERYTWERLRLRGLSSLLSLLWLALLGPLHGASSLRDMVRPVTSAWPLQVLIFFGVLGVAYSLSILPVSYYAGFILPHRYGLSTQSRTGWFADIAKGGVLGGLVACAGVEALYACLHWAPAVWWLCAWALLTVVSVVLTMAGPVLILPLFFTLRPLADGGLAEAVRQLAERAGAQVAGVGEIDLSTRTVAANAAVIGLGRTRRIVLGDTLLSSFPQDEIEVVVAHELRHHVHHDLTRGIAAGAVLSLGGFAAAGFALHVTVSAMGFAAPWDLAAFPAIVAALGLWSALTRPLDLALSRSMESAADAFSLQLTANRDAYIRSELRLTNQNLAWYNPPRWLEALVYTHPAPWRRVAMGDGFPERQTG